MCVCVCARAHLLRFVPLLIKSHPCLCACVFASVRLSVNQEQKPAAVRSKLRCSKMGKLYQHGDEPPHRQAGAINIFHICKIFEATGAVALALAGVYPQMHAQSTHHGKPQIRPENTPRRRTIVSRYLALSSLFPIRSKGKKSRQHKRSHIGLSTHELAAVPSSEASTPCIRDAHACLNTLTVGVPNAEMAWGSRGRMYVRTCCISRREQECAFRRPFSWPCQRKQMGT